MAGEGEEHGGAVDAEYCLDVLLGDVFDYWYEYKKVVPRGFVRFLGKLASLADEGIEVLTTETFAKGDTDFSAQLTKIQALEPDAIVLSALAEEAANIMIQARQLGIPEDVRFIGGNGFNSPKLFELGGEAANGAISGSAWNISSTR